MKAPASSKFSLISYTARYAASVILMAGLFPAQVHAQTIRPLSKGWYRLPYDEDWTGPDGAAFEGIEEGGLNLFNNNHNGYDVTGLPFQIWNSSKRHEIVAMADGVVCKAVDCWDECSDCTLDCCNNEIWIEHPNGEFSVYIHIAFDSLQVAVGNCVVAGQHIADEGDVGATANTDTRFNRPKLGCDGNEDFTQAAYPLCGVHLHYGVYSTLNLPPGSDVDDYHVIPRFCGLSDHVVKGGRRHTPATSFGNCDTFSCAETDVIEPNSFNGEQKVIVASNSITTSKTTPVIIQNSVIGYEAGNTVTLNPGFRAVAGCYFRASIGSCYSAATGCPAPGLGGCPDPDPQPPPPPCPDP